MSISGTALAQPREYFSNDLYDADDEMPNALVEEYYGALTGMSFGEWFYGPYATADWFGERTRLEECGIVPVVTYLGNFAGNVSGGFSRGAAVSSSVQFGAGIDLYKATKIESLENWSLVNAWVWRFGDSLSRRRVGNAFSVQQNFGSQTLNLQSLYLSYSAPIMDECASLMLKFGRIAAGDNFMTKPIYWLYKTNAIDGNPIGVYLQTRFSAYPGSAWGAMFEIENRRGFYFKSGVYQINSREQDLRHGFDFSMTKALGVNVNAEAGWNVTHDGSGRSPGTQRDEPRLFPQKPRLGRFSAAVFSDGRFCGFIGAPHSHRFGGGLEVCCSDARFRTDCSGAAARCAADETCCPGSG